MQFLARKQESIAGYLLERFKRAKSLRRALLVGAVGRGMQLVIMWLFVQLFGLHYVFANILSVAILFVVGYTASKYWTFGKDTHD